MAAAFIKPGAAWRGIRWSTHLDISNSREDEQPIYTRQKACGYGYRY